MAGAHRFLLRSAAWALLLLLTSAVPRSNPKNSIQGSRLLGESLEQFSNRAGAFLQGLEPTIQEWCIKSTNLEWNYATNLTDYNEQRMLEGRLQYSKYAKEQWSEVVQWDWKVISDENVRRQFKFHSVLGKAALPEEKLKRYDKLQSVMKKTYSTAKICSFQDPEKCDLGMEPEITEIMAKSRDPAELEHTWLQWRENSGKKIREEYLEFAQLIDDVAKANNFTDGTEYWLYTYDTEDFRDQLAAIWNQLRPLYQQLHAYVRNRLRKQYGDDIVSDKGPIPAHLLGNMWAQSWSNLLDFCKPYPEKQSVDVTPQMKEQGYTPLRMFQMSDHFFTSLGLKPMTPEFWNNSVLEKPDDGRELVCHASAWDFCDGKDVRIKQCTQVNMRHLVTAHHEMGHIEYYLQYSSQPLVYRRGANPGFHEAVGDTLALSVGTPKHLKEVGLLQEVVDDPEIDMNFLMAVALDKISFLPFGYLMDRWRWGVFSGDTTNETLNCDWWKLRLELQGIQPPKVRSELDFDPGAKYHIPANVPYIRYFVSFIIQFQFHKALCLKANQYDPADPNKPLHQCDIYRNKEAGKLLADMLQLGRSRPWPDAMEAITGQRNMDASALLEYFRPLELWLKEENLRTGEHVGWETDKDICVPAPAAEAREPEVSEPEPQAEPTASPSKAEITEKEAEELKKAA